MVCKYLPEYNMIAYQLANALELDKLFGIPYMNSFLPFLQGILTILGGWLMLIYHI